jgi:hypothetical protein
LIFFTEFISWIIHGFTPQLSTYSGSTVASGVVSIYALRFMPFSIPQVFQKIPLLTPLAP